MITGGTTIPVAQIVRDASRELGDTEQRKYGYVSYISAAQRALSTICKDVPCDVRHWETQIPSDLIVKLPWGTTEKSLVVLFNGPKCNFNHTRTLFIKPNMYHQGQGTYVANNMGYGNDIVPGYLNWNLSNWWGNSLYYAGESNGNLYLSLSCQQFDGLHVTYSGLGMECWGDDFCVPEWAREAIIDMVILRAAKTLRSLTNQSMYREIIKEKMEATAITNVNGTWQQALCYWGRMDQKQRNDTWTYTTWIGTPPY